MGLKVSAELERLILAQASVGSEPLPATKRKPTPVESSAPRRIVVEVDIPCRTVSEANTGGSLRGKLARKSKVKAIAADCLPDLKTEFPLPCVVTLTRFGTRKLDSDNLAASLKAVRDVVAKWLSVDDGDEGPRGKVRWRYKQAAAWAPFVRVRVETV
jgi:hypothetical protein